MQKRKLHPALKVLLAVVITAAVLTGLIFGVLFATSLRPEDYGFDPDWIIGRSKQEIIAHYGGDEKYSRTVYQLRIGTDRDSFHFLPTQNSFIIEYNENDIAVRCQMYVPFWYSPTDTGFGTDEYPYDIQWMMGKPLKEVEARYGATEEGAHIPLGRTEPYRMYRVVHPVALLLFVNEDGIVTRCVEEYFE